KRRTMQTMPPKPAVEKAGYNPQGLLGTPAAASAAYLGVQQDVGELKRAIRDLTKQVSQNATGDVPAALQCAYRALRGHDLTRGMAKQIVFAARDTAPTDKHGCTKTIKRLVQQELRQRLPVAGPIVRKQQGRPHVTALIGPTGVGKTTTVAKLAANLSGDPSQKVGLITIDTYRIAAVDQLKKYAEILELPLHVVTTPAEIKDAIAKLGDCAHVLIDTAGRSPKDATKLAELKQFIAAASPDEVHLVLSATCGRDSTRLALQRFAGVRADKLIFTKLDEAAQLGVMLDIACGSVEERGGRPLPLSYVTGGQIVPDDIESACGIKLAEQLTDKLDDCGELVQ
ncbi:MAG: hypothetical protein AAGK78_09295, partial [Planctomycetota bacterium]